MDVDENCQEQMRNAADAARKRREARRRRILADSDQRMRKIAGYSDTSAGKVGSKFGWAIMGEVVVELSNNCQMKKYSLYCFLIMKLVLFGIKKNNRIVKYLVLDLIIWIKVE